MLLQDPEADDDDDDDDDDDGDDDDYDAAADDDDDDDHGGACVSPRPHAVVGLGARVSYHFPMMILCLCCWWWFFHVDDDDVDDDDDDDDADQRCGSALRVQLRNFNSMRDVARLGCGNQSQDKGTI